MLPKDTRIGLLATITWPIPPAAYGAWERVVTNLANGLVAADPGFNAAFDLEGDGDVDGLDFLQFRARFGTSV